MSYTIASDHVNHFGVANCDYICTQSNGGTFLLPKDTRIIIVDMNLCRDKVVIRWHRAPEDDLYSRLSIQAARSLIITLPERRYTTYNSQDQMLMVATNVHTIDKYNNSITYGGGHSGYVSCMSTDGMFFIVNILHGPDMGRKGVRVHVKYGRVWRNYASEITYWMHRRVSFLKDYTCVDSKGQTVHRFRKGDRSCVVRGIGSGDTILRLTSRKVQDSQIPLRVDIAAHAVEPDTVYHAEDQIYFNSDALFEDGHWLEGAGHGPKAAAAAEAEAAANPIRWAMGSDEEELCRLRPGIPLIREVELINTGRNW
jgi:hypothetical protein